MAACNLGASSCKMTSLNLVCTTPKLTGFRVVKTQSLIRSDGLLISLKAKKPLVGCLSSASEAQSKTSSDGNQEKIVPSAAVAQLLLNSSEIEHIITEVSDSTSIAEFELKLGGFRLYVLRNLPGPSTPPPIPVSATVLEAVEAPNSDGLISTPSLALGGPLASSGGNDALLARAAAEGLVVVQSPRVGIFKISRTVKGNPAPPACKENQEVKEGQVIGYIEQLGAEMPIEADVSGVVVKILAKDGAPVGYGDPLICILPSFPGIEELE